MKMDIMSRAFALGALVLHGQQKNEWQCVWGTQNIFMSTGTKVTFNEGKT